MEKHLCCDPSHQHGHDHRQHLHPLPLSADDASLFISKWNIFVQNQLPQQELICRVSISGEADKSISKTFSVLPNQSKMIPLGGDEDVKHSKPTVLLAVKTENQLIRILRELKEVTSTRTRLIVSETDLSCATVRTVNPIEWAKEEEKHELN